MIRSAVLFFIYRKESCPEDFYIIEHDGIISYNIKKQPLQNRGMGVIMLFLLYRILSKKYIHMFF